MVFPYSIKLLSKKTIAPDLLDLIFVKPQNFTFVAGQFIQFEFFSGAKKIVRSYSIASAPEDIELRFCVKLIPDGKASEYFAKMKEGDSLPMSSPRGLFGADSEIANKIFVSTGTGLAPAISIIRDKTFTNSPVKIKLIFGLRHEQDIFWADRLEELKQKNSNFDYTITLSRPSEKWAGLKGRVTEHLPINTSAIYYLCGNIAMVKDVRSQLLSFGVNTKNINLEMY